MDILLICNFDKIKKRIIRPKVTNYDASPFAYLSAYQYHGVTYIALAVLFLYTFLIAFGSLKGFPTSMSTGFVMPYLADKPVGEDGYYMLTVAWNIASGYGISIRPGEFTTGIQPLATFIYAFIAKIIILLDGNKFDLAIWVIIIGGANQIIFALIVGAITSLIARNILKDGNTAVAISIIVVATSYYLFRVFTYGLETGIYLTLFALTIYLSLKVFSSINNGLDHNSAHLVQPRGDRAHLKQALAHPNPHRSGGLGRIYDQGFNNQTTSRLVLVGFIAGLTGLARIDFGIIFAVFLLFILVFKKIRLSQAVIVGLIALAVVYPWLAWVKLISGHWIPLSGIAQSLLIDAGSFQGRAWACYGAISQNILPSLFTGGKISLVVFTLPPTLVSIYLMIDAHRSWESPEKFVWMAWLLGCLTLILFYPVFFWATHFYARYTSPLLVVVLPIFSIAVTSISLKARFLSVRPVRYIVFTAISLITLNATLAFFSLHTGSIGNSHSVSAGYVREYLPTSSTVGAFQSGVIGYYNDNVVNLDGKVNPDVLVALAKGRVNDYVIERNIDYVIDWSGAIDASFLAVPKAEDHWEKCENLIPNNASLCIQRLR